MERPALAGTRFSIHDVVMDDLSKKYMGGGNGFEIANSWPSNPINTITINHVTVFPDPESHALTVGNTDGNPRHVWIGVHQQPDFDRPVSGLECFRSRKDRLRFGRRSNHQHSELFYNKHVPESTV